MGGDEENRCRVVRAQPDLPVTASGEPRPVSIVLVGREEAAPLGFPNS